jgi:hypothetical protein
MLQAPVERMMSGPLPPTFTTFAPAETLNELNQVSEDTVHVPVVQLKLLVPFPSQVNQGGVFTV